MVIFTALPAGTSDEGRIVVDESDYQGVDDEQLPFEIKDVVRIRANEKFSKYYECMDELGEGKFGKVYRCREKATGLELAAKRIKIKRDADREKVEREVAIMTQLRHPRIAQIYDAFATPDNDVVLVMEIVNGGELFDRVVDENYVLTEMAVVMIVCQLCEAISYIHSKNIVHLDIKPENIMCVSQTGNRIKLIDFGLAQFYDGSSNLLFMAGTPEFVAPEVIKFEPIDFHTDMWSIGVITYILLSGISPFLGETLGDTYVAVEKGEWEFDDEAFEGISAAAKDFITKLLIMDQKQRMLPEECLNHTWVVGTRAKAANDLILNQPNTGAPLSKEGLKSYLRNKRFRKATWALVFLIRFKRQTLMNFGRRKVSATVVEMSDDTTTSREKANESITLETNVTGTAEPVWEEQQTQKVSIDIPITVEEYSDVHKAESVTAIKHPEEKKLSSEIPKKKPKPSTSDEGRTKKKAKKHKEKSSEKSDEMSCKPKKVQKHPKMDRSIRQEKEPTEAVSTRCEKEVSRSDVDTKASVISEVCITLGTKQPAASFAEFTKPVRVAESTYLHCPFSGVARTSKDEAEATKRRSIVLPSVSNHTTHEVTNYSGSVSKLSEINKKGSSVAAILSMFTEKAEQERRRFERRPSRPVRTFRDVEKPASRKTSVASNHENEVICMKLYRAPDEEKERVKNLIELHRRGSADRKQVNTQEIVAVKHEESLKGPKKRKDLSKSPSRVLAVAEQNKEEAEGKSATKKKARTKPLPNPVKGLNQLGSTTNKILVPGLPLPELKSTKKSCQVSTVLDNNTTAISESSVQSTTKVSQKSMGEVTTYKKVTEDNERSAKSAIQGEMSLPQAPYASLQKPASQSDSSVGHFQNVAVEDGNAAEDGKQTRRLIRNVRKQNGMGENTEAESKVSDWKSTSGIGKKAVTAREGKRLIESRKDSPRDSSDLESKQEQQPASKIKACSEKKRDAKKELSEIVSCRSVSSGRKKSKDAAAAEGDPDAKSTDEKLKSPTKAKKLNQLRSTSSRGDRNVNVSVEKVSTTRERAASFGSSNLSCKVKQVQLSDGIRSGTQRSTALRPLPVNLSKTTKYTDDVHTLEELQGVVSRKPPKFPGTSERRKVTEKTKAKKLRNGYESDGEVMNSAFRNTEKANGPAKKKVSESVDGALNKTQDAATNIRCQARDMSSVDALSRDATKRKLSRKSSSPKNSLIKIKSEINLAERAREVLSTESNMVRFRRKAVDDQSAFNNRTKETRHSITIASLKHHENFNFGWLKLQLESRVNKEKQDHTAWRPRRDLEISPIQTGNAKKALNIWKTMEQSCIART